MSDSNEHKLSANEEESLNNALSLYEKGEYFETLKLLDPLIKTNPVLENELKYIVKFCNQVISIKQNGDDYLYEISRVIKRYLWLLAIPGLYLLIPLFNLSSGQISEIPAGDIFRMILGAFVLFSAFQINSYLPSDSGERKLKCKYCGRLTRNIAPNEGVAYLGSNNCSVCGRSYPMPSAYWDTEEGVKYMYERRSVTEPEFYLEFEREHKYYPKSEITRKYEKQLIREEKRLAD